MKKSWIKKGIVILITIAISLAPISAGVKINDKGNFEVGVEVNEARALDSEDFAKMANGIKVNLATILSGEKKSIKIRITIPEEPTIQCKDDNDCSEKIPMLVFLYEKPDKTKEGDGWEENGILRNITKEYEPIKDFSYLLRNKTEEINFENLNKEKDYLVSLVVYTNRESLVGPWEKAAAVVSPIAGILVASVKIKELLSKTPAALEYFYLIKNDITDGDLTTGIGSGVFNAYWEQQPFDLGCSLMPTKPNLVGCIAQIFYTTWGVSAVIAKFAGNVLDFFVYYSTNDNSYRNEFVSQAWGAVRDIANIFFIIALLYVAIKTILGLNVTNNKKLIGAVIIIALIINFSLFTTKVVIDGSNILAKVFYNNITSKDDKGNSATGASGQKSISIGLIEKYNPQKLLDTDQSKAQQKYNDSPGTFIFYTILLIAITLYTAFIFFSVALLFVARVVSLWISMIFSPIAFVSYAVPFEIPGFGHKEWWGELLKNAFLAPIFIFFLYIIILFAGFLKTITDNTDSLLTVTIPFIILVVLLKKAKDLAVKYSGEIGASITKYGAMAGGLALGAATGGLAMAGRATVGRAGAAMANSGWAKKWEAAGWGGGMARSVFKAGAKGSFDVRGVKIAGKDLSSTGLTSLGKPKEGGFEKRRAEQVEKRQKRAKELEVGEDEGLKQTVRQKEAKLHEVKTGDMVNAAGVTVRRQDEIVKLNNGTPYAENLAAQANQQAARAAQVANPMNPALIAVREAATKAELATEGLAGLERNVTAAERAVATAERAVKDAEANLAAANATGTPAQRTAAQDALDNARQDRDARINGGKLVSGERVDIGNSQMGARETLETRQANLRAAEGPVKEAENMLKLAENAVISENNQRKHEYTHTTQGAWSQTVQFITSGGQHSFAGEREAANKILADVQEEKKITNH